MVYEFYDLERGIKWVEDKDGTLLFGPVPL